MITFDNRGIGATEQADGFAIEQMVADTAALIEKLDAAPVRIVAVSMGSFIAQELMVARPELVRSAVLMATRGRHDRTRDFFRTAERELADVRHRAACRLRREDPAAGELLAEDAQRRRCGARLDRHVHHVADQADARACAAQLDVGPHGNRLPAYRSITAPVLVIGFADDVVLPPHLGREVADALPNGRYLEIPDTGHLGFIEQPQVVNAAALEFFAA